jgi:hypothetical protein
MHVKEFDTVIKLKALIRYEYFIKKVLDYEEIWGLYENGWAITKDDDGNVLLPYWPKKEYAQYCAFYDWSSYLPKKIDLEEFISEWIPGMKKDGLKASIFWNRHDSVAADPERLLSDLNEELEKY